MLSRRGICRPSRFETSDVERMRKFIQEAIDVLKRFPEPDTFIGRKTQEPFPREAQATEKNRRRLSQLSSTQANPL
jgi:hypothetical protein